MHALYNNNASAESQSQLTSVGLTQACPYYPLSDLHLCEVE